MQIEQAHVCATDREPVSRCNKFALRPVSRGKSELFAKAGGNIHSPPFVLCLSEGFALQEGTTMTPRAISWVSLQTETIVPVRMRFLLSVHFPFSFHCFCAARNVLTINCPFLDFPSCMQVGSPEKAPYVAAKHGLVGLTKAVALETAGTGVTCNAICPGWVRTPLVEAQIEANAQRAGISVEAATKELLRDKHPSEEFVAPDDIAEFCAFLCSPAASQMTGAALSMDGGWVAR
mmetsp:Transcript_4668/g.9383  ORF Transcript_4668/g.9383 Transcript_4668/m.9383 type:complete len:234 (+) Transcript_4668:14-715(+)